MSTLRAILALVAAAVVAACAGADTAADASGASPALDGGAPLTCGGLTEGAVCVVADWQGYQCFNGNCYYDCATACSCVQGIWRCAQGCRSMMGTYPDGGVVPCGSSPKCWSMCGAQPP